MKTPLELATEHAYAFVHNRGWRVESLTWEEVAVLLEEMQQSHWFHCSCEEAS